MHTAGPWEFQICRDPEAWAHSTHAGRPCWCYVITAPAGAQVQGLVALTPSRYAEHELCDEANARLIAAAPQMFQALTTVQGLLRQIQAGTGPDSERVTEALTAVNGALAIAMGDD